MYDLDVSNVIEALTLYREQCSTTHDWNNLAHLSTYRFLEMAEESKFAQLLQTLPEFLEIMKLSSKESLIYLATYVDSWLKLAKELWQQDAIYRVGLLDLVESPNLYQGRDELAGIRMYASQAGLQAIGFYDSNKLHSLTPEQQAKCLHLGVQV